MLKYILLPFLLIPFLIGAIGIFVAVETMAQRQSWHPVTATVISA